MSPERMLLLIVLLPLAGALLGYVLRRSADFVAYLSIGTLLMSAALSIVLLGQLAAQPDEAREPVTLNLGAITLPSAQQVQLSLLVPLSEVPEEQRSQYYHEVARGLAENPAVQSVPIAFSAGRSQLLFTLTTALIAALCLLFGLWERRGDPRRGYFFATLTLFSSAMLLFLCADTLLLVYLAWELMGLCSFLLIGYPGTEQARRAAREAFWTTRATDFGLLFAVLIMMGRWGWTTLSSISVNELLLPLLQAQQQDPTFDALAFASANIFPWFGAVAILVLFATMGKLAMFPLSFWLPGAMVAPAPVSALLHAATMVAAGPFLLTRLFGFFQYSEPAMATAVILGGLSLVLCGLMALTARDAKQVLAYSTISQLSVAVVGVGVLNYNAAVYHILAHAWLKAPLFIAVGYLAVLASRHAGGAAHVAQHSGDAHDHDDHTLLQRMAGAAKSQPLVLATLVLAGASLAGVWGLAGFFGKESILLSLLTRAQMQLAEGHTYATDYPLATLSWSIGAALLLLSIPLTAAYAARLVAVLGWGRNPEQAAAASRSGSLVTTGLALLAALVGSLGLGLLTGQFLRFVTQPGDEWRWGGEGVSPALITGLDVALVLLAIAFTIAIVLSAKTHRLPASLARVGSFFASGMYLREFWTTLVGRGGTLVARLADKSEREVVARVMDRTGHDGRRLARASDWFDRHIVDGLRYWGAEAWWLIRRGHQRLLQTGSIQHYMLVIVISTVLLCFIVLRPLAKAFGEILGRM
jgi:NADH-quinone oxidoreductase subunit L